MYTVDEWPAISRDLCPSIGCETLIDCLFVKFISMLGEQLFDHPPLPKPGGYFG